MAITDFPWFKVYAAETLSDENFCVWSLAQRGIFFTLLCHCWKEGSIPSDPDKLASLCGCDARAFPEHWSGIAHRFNEHGNGMRLVSPRLEFERQKSLEESEKKSNHGRTGANARWSKYKKDMPEQCPTHAQPMPNDAPKPEIFINKVTPKKMASRGSKPSQKTPKEVLATYPKEVGDAFWLLNKTWAGNTQKVHKSLSAYLEAIETSSSIIIQQAAELEASRRGKFSTSLDVWIEQNGWLALTGGE